MFKQILLDKLLFPVVLAFAPSLFYRSNPFLVLLLSDHKAYYEEHGRAIVNLMREDRSLNAKTIVRNRYNDEWICHNQLLPLLEG